VLEFNARFGDPETEVILPRIGSDVAALLAACVRGELDKFSPIDVRPEVSVAVVLCAGGYPGPHETGHPITGLADAAQVPNVEIFHAGTARDGDRLVTAGGRIFVVTATAPTITEAAMNAYEAASRIKFEGKHLRRDIAGSPIRPSRV
jgi:phosphoribosylamine--glycine ligase